MNNEIVLIHNNYSWYLQFTINNAKFYNNNITLLGNNLNNLQKLKVDKIIDLSKYSDSEKIILFKKLYFHLSPNSYDYELFCFLRWFYLFEYVKEYNLDYVLYIDSDYLLFDNLNNILNLTKINYAAFSIPKQSYSTYYWTASGHVSIWTKESLEDFCNFIIRAYSEISYIDKLKEKFNNSCSGGICDMTVFYLFYLEKESLITNLVNISNSYTHDHNINSSDNYLPKQFCTLFDIKFVFFYKGIPYFLDNRKNKIQAGGIHCQGTSKILIPLLYKGGKNLLFYKYYLYGLIHFIKYISIYVIKKILRPIKRILIK